MTALPPKADVHPRSCYVAFVPEAAVKQFGDLAIALARRECVKGSPMATPQCFPRLSWAALLCGCAHPLPNFAWLMAQPEGQTREPLSSQFSVHGPTSSRNSG